MYRIILTLALVFVVAACSSSRHEKEDGAAETRSADGTATDSAATPRIHQVGAKSSRIIGTIVAVDATPHSNDPDHPAAKYPSVATVRIDSVLLTGSKVSHPFQPGQTATITFAYTLSPTKGIVAHLRKDYPGLGVGARFQAEVLERVLPVEKASHDFATTPLVIYDYQLL